MEIGKIVQYNAQKGGVNTSFKGRYNPRDYRGARDLAERVYENSTGMQKVLMSLKKNSGENLNNIITAVGTACIAPIFITYNPFSKEDENTKKYSALRQPISAAIALAVQLPLMKAYNNWIDRHAALLGIEGMDLKAKPPASVLKSKAKADYKMEKAKALRNNEVPPQKSKWIREYIVKLQDDAFYGELNQLRKSPKFIDGVDVKSLVKSSSIDSAKDDVFKKYLIENFSFTEEELKDVSKFNDLSKKHKNLLKDHGLTFKKLEEPVLKLAEEHALKNVLDCIENEAKVKLETSKCFEEMTEKVRHKKISIIREHEKYVLEAKNNISKASANLSKAEKALKESPADKNLQILLDNAKNNEEKAKRSLAICEKNGPNFIERGYSLAKKEAYDECILAVDEKLKTLKDEEKELFEFVSKKLKKAGSMDNVKYHGNTYKQVERSVKIKKMLTTAINEAEAKLKNWKDRSGLVFGLMILPVVCGVLNWAYPRIMEHYFPELAAAKKNKAAIQNKNNQNPSNVKEVK